MSVSSNLRTFVFLLCSVNAGVSSWGDPACEQMLACGRGGEMCVCVLKTSVMLWEEVAGRLIGYKISNKNRI